MEDGAELVHRSHGRGDDERGDDDGGLLPPRVLRGDPQPVGELAQEGKGLPDHGYGGGGLSTVGPQRTLYIQGLVSQNRNSTKKLAGPGGCNLAYTVCDPAPVNIVVGRTYTYKLYVETSTAYKQLETFANFPTSIVEVISTSAIYSNPSGASSSSIYADACGWNPTTRACVGPANIPGGKAGGRVVVTYVVKAIAPGSATLRATIYDFSGASYHYNSDFDSVTLTTHAAHRPLRAGDRDSQATER